MERKGPNPSKGSMECQHLGPGSTHLKRLAKELQVEPADRFLISTGLFLAFQLVGLGLLLLGEVSFERQVHLDKRTVFEGPRTVAAKLSSVWTMERDIFERVGALIWYGETWSGNLQVAKNSPERRAWACECPGRVACRGRTWPIWRCRRRPTDTCVCKRDNKASHRRTCLAT